MNSIYDFRLLSSFLPLVFVNVFFLSLMVYFRIFLYRRITVDMDEKQRKGSAILPIFLREYWIWAMNPAVSLLVRLKVSPNMLTVGGFLLGCLAAASFYKGYFGLAGWAIIFAGTLDLFDGMVARRLNLQTRQGAFFDSVLDRAGESIMFLGIASYYAGTYWMAIVFMAYVGSMMVSYTRARGESLGVLCSGGLMQRPERIYCIGMASIFTPLLTFVLYGNPYIVGTEYLFFAVLIAMAVLTNNTAIRRSIDIMNGLKEKGMTPTA